MDITFFCEFIGFAHKKSKTKLLTGLEVSTKSSNVPETRTERTTEPNVQSKTTRNSQIQTDGVTENVSANPNGTASGTDSKKLILH